jgi:hypothetical protein
MLIDRVTLVKSITKDACPVSLKTFVPKIPFAGSFNVNGLPKVAPVLKLSDTSNVANGII